MLYSSPPGTPKDRVQIGRRFIDTMKDPEFLADAKRRLARYRSGPRGRCAKGGDKGFKLDAAFVAKLREMLK
jgi:hypothetical protein